MILSGDTCEVSDCKISDITPGTSGNAYGVAFTMNNASTDLVATPRSIHCKAIRNIITNIPVWEALDTHGGDDILFKDNEIRNCKHGIVAGKTGVNVGALLVNAINNNITVNKNGYGIVFTNDLSGSTFITGSITGNIIKEAGIDGFSPDLGAIQLEKTIGVRVSENTILDAAGHGIVIFQKNVGALISKNSIVDPQTPDSVLWDVACVAVRSTDNSAIIDGNAFIRSGNISGKKVAVCGFLMDTTSGCEITMGQNFNSCTLPLAGTLASVVRHGRFFGQAGKFVGTGAPAFAASVGSEYTDVSGSTGTVFYINEDGTSGGWVAK